MPQDSIGSWVVDPVTQVELWVPPYGTPERAIHREARRRDGLLRVIEFYPDGGWFLWEPAGDLSPLIPSDLGLSEGLSSRMREWHDYWNTSFRLDAGWPNCELADRWECEGDLLLGQLREALWDVAEVVAKYRPAIGDLNPLGN